MQRKNRSVQDPCHSESEKPSTAAVSAAETTASALVTSFRLFVESKEKAVVVEIVSRILFPFMFLVFNLVYWPMYLSWSIRRGTPTLRSVFGTTICRLHSALLADVAFVGAEKPSELYIRLHYFWSSNVVYHPSSPASCYNIRYSKVSYSKISLSSRTLTPTHLIVHLPILDLRNDPNLISYSTSADPIVYGKRTPTSFGQPLWRARE